MKNSTKHINEFLNLKFRIIESLRSQNLREDWTYPTLLSTGVHKVHFENLNKK